MRLTKTDFEQIGNTLFIVVTDSEGEDHLISVRNDNGYAVELKTAIELGIRALNAPEGALVDEIKSQANIAALCPECGSDAPQQKCTAQCGKEKF